MYLIKKILCFCLLILALLGENSYAQKYPFFNLNIEDGLIQSQATSILQDSNGHLWIGTIGGLSRYDGTSFKNYTIRDGMPSNSVYSLAIDKHNHLWIGTTKGLCYYDGEYFKSIVPAGGKPNNLVTQIYFAGEQLWCLMGNKLFYIKNDTLQEEILPADSLLLPSFYVDNSDLYIAASNGAVYKKQKENDWKRLYVANDSAYKVYIIKFKRTDALGIQLLSTAGVFTIRENIIEPYLPKHLSRDVSYTDVVKDQKGQLWYTTNNSVLMLKDSSIKIFNKKNGLSDNRFFSVFNDKEGNVWFASDGQGVFRYSGAMFFTLDESTGLPSRQIVSIAATNDGVLYLGTYEEGLLQWQGGSTKRLYLPDKASNVNTLAIYNGYELWIGTRNNLWRYKANVFRAYNSPVFPSNFVTSLYNDGAANLWIGFSNGLVKYNKDSFSRVPGFSHYVQALLRIGKDSLLIASSEGLMLYRQDTLSRFVTGTAIDSFGIQCMTLRDKEIWFGTEDNGLMCYNLQTKSSYALNKTNGLQSDFIYNIITDSKNNIWAGTGNGIHRIRFSSNIPKIDVYGKGQGIPGVESNHNAVFKTSEGNIWFGTTAGAVMYNVGSYGITPIPISIMLTGIRIFGTEISPARQEDRLSNWFTIPRKLYLAPSQNNITFSFNGISLTGSEQLLYRYRIEHLDANWSDWSTQKSVTYSALPPGKYIFKVQAAIGSEYKELDYPFEIATPFSSTIWFKLIIVGACVLLGVLVQYILGKRKQNRLQLLEALRKEEQNKVRERTAEDFHDEVGNRLTRISLLATILKSKLNKDTAPDTEKILNQIQENTKQLYSGTKDILWSLQPSNDNLFEILLRIRSFGEELFQDSDIAFSFTEPDEHWKHYSLPMDISRNVIMIFKEALNNCLKYAQARNVSIDVSFNTQDILKLKLKDDGVGFDMNNRKMGNGINNMQVRARRINGILYIDSRNNKGTITTLTFKIPPKK